MSLPRELDFYRMDELAALARELRLSGYVYEGSLVLARVAPIVTLAPFLGGQALSASIRTIVALAIVVVIYPGASQGQTIPDATGIYFLLLAKEALVGTILGLLAAVTFHVLSMAGQLVDQSRGATQGQVSSFIDGEEESPLASLKLQLGVVLFLLLGGHRAFLAAVAGSYDAIPLASLPISPEGVREVALAMAQLLGGALAAAVMLAAPAFSAILMTDLSLGLLGRTAPQLGTYFMAMPLRAAVGLAVTLLVLSLFMSEIVPFLESVVGSAAGMMHLLGRSP